MTRIRIGIIVLALLVLSSIATEWYVYHETNVLLSELSQIEQAMETSALEAVQEPFETFEAHWEKSEKLFSILVWRDRVQQVDVSVARLNPMRVENCDELKAELAETRIWLEHLGAGEIPLLRNVF